MKKKEKYLLKIGTICLCCSLVFGITYVIVGNMFYRKAVQAAQSITDSEEKNELLTTAIHLQPRKAQAYELLLGEFTSDGKIEESEYQSLVDIVKSQGIPFMQSQSLMDATASIAMGCVSMHGDNHILGLKSALPFLSQFSKSHKKSPNVVMDSYLSIADFYETYIWTGLPSSMSETEVQEMLDMILMTCTQIQIDKTISDLDRLSFSMLVCEMIIDQRNTLAANCSLRMVKSVIDSVYNSLPILSEDADPIEKQMLDHLISEKNTYWQLIERSFNRGKES